MALPQKVNSRVVATLQRVVNVIQGVLRTGVTPVVPKVVRLYGLRTVLAYPVTRLRISVLLYLEYTVDSVRRIVAVDFLLFVIPIPRALSLVRALYRGFVVVKLVNLSTSNRSR